MCIVNNFIEGEVAHAHETFIQTRPEETDGLIFFASAISSAHGHDGFARNGNCGAHKTKIKECVSGGHGANICGLARAVPPQKARFLARAAGRISIE